MSGNLLVARAHLGFQVGGGASIYTSGFGYCACVTRLRESAACGFLIAPPPVERSSYPKVRPDPERPESVQEPDRGVDVAAYVIPPPARGQIPGAARAKNATPARTQS